MMGVDEDGFVLEIPSVEDRAPDTLSEGHRNTLMRDLYRASSILAELARDIDHLTDADEIVDIINLLGEVAVAVQHPPARLTPGALLELAGDTLRTRGGEYGPSDAFFERTSQMWSAILEHNVEPHHVPLCMAALKTLRLTVTPRHTDSWVDLAGYAALGASAAGARGAL
jgi:hypothetical protein